MLYSQQTLVTMLTGPCVSGVCGNGHCNMYHCNHSTSINVGMVFTGKMAGMLLWRLVLQPQRVASMGNVTCVAKQDI